MVALAGHDYAEVV